MKSRCKPKFEKKMLIPLYMKRNKLTPKKIILNYKLKSKIVSYPTLTINSNNYNHKNEDRQIFKAKAALMKKKIIVKYYKEKFFSNYEIANRNKISNIAKNSFSVYGINKNFSKIYCSMGSIIQISLHETKKLLLMSSFNIENIEDLYLFCSPLEHQVNFLEFFFELSNFDSIEMKENFFKISMQKFLIHRLILNESYFQILEKLKIYDLVLFDLPDGIYPHLELSSLSQIDLKNDIKIINDIITEKSYKKQELIILSTNFDNSMHHDMFEKVTIIKEIEKLSIKNKLCINLGEYYPNNSKMNYFCSSASSGAVGSLIYSLKNLKNPIGLNVGYDKNVNKNKFISFNSKEIQNLFKNLLFHSDKDTINLY